MVRMLEKVYKDIIDGVYKEVKKYIVEYEYQGEKYTHYYKKEKHAKQHLKSLKKWGV